MRSERSEEVPPPMGVEQRSSNNVGYGLFSPLEMTSVVFQWWEVVVVVVCVVGRWVSVDDVAKSLEKIARSPQESKPRRNHIEVRQSVFLKIYLIHA